jgi:type IV secretion system protein VirB6
MMTMQWNRWNRGIMLGLVAIVLLGAGAHAQTTPAATSTVCTPPDSEQCTSFGSRKELFDQEVLRDEDGNLKQGLLSEIYLYVTDIVQDSTQRLYESFIDNTAYRAAVGGAMTLMIIIFGVGFMIGIIQPSFGQALVRLLKFAFVAAMISPTGWAFFSSGDNGGIGIAQFFNEGTDELVVGVTKIATGVQSLPADATPFYQLDKLAEFIIQPDTIIALLGFSFSGGPYALAISGLMIISTIYFIKMLIKALQTYAISYVARALLLGVAPIFVVFLLFDRTKQLFMSWLNALLVLSLKPILLFTFLSFFMVMVESATKDMLNTELCWTEYTNVEGSTNKQAFWRPVDPKTCQPITSTMDWNGALQCLISGSNDCPEFPMNIVDVLTFLLLIYLAERFAGVVDRLANELGNAYIALDPGQRFQQVMETGKGGQVEGANQNRTVTPGQKPKG